MHELIRQLEIIHLSDIHFGPEHRFIPPLTPDGDRGSSIGIPKLVEKLQEDLSGKDPGTPLIFCITGDITTSASYKEFEDAEEFINKLTQIPILGQQRSLKSIFLVPGNHDVNYAGKVVGERWQHWIELNNRLFGTTIKREDPWALCKVHDLIDSFGVVVLSLNSSIYVQKDTLSERRGEIDHAQLLKIKKELADIPDDKLESAIRIALVHHHPVLIPSLVEGDRGYDAVLGSDKLLTILHRFGFHLLLHGHKHYPVTFLERVSSAFVEIDDQPIMVVAGGSAGSTGLPDHPKKTNSYNRITVKWHPEAGQARIRVITRGMQLYDDDDERLPGEWAWKTLKEEDKSFYKGSSFPIPEVESLHYRPYDAASPDQDNDARILEYEKVRGNMPVVEVMPSLEPDQAYEARCWIVGHKRKPNDVPTQVTWSAGHKFPLLTVTKDDGEDFCGIFDYWGPMLIQAHMSFPEGPPIKAHVYARMPRNYRPIGQGEERNK